MLSEQKGSVPLIGDDLPGQEQFHKSSNHKSFYRGDSMESQNFRKGEQRI